MADRRMFTKKITESDAFLNMSTSAQALYFHLSMNADDDGFVNNLKSIQRMCGASEDDIKLLLMRSFIIAFDSGVIVIKHWRMHNFLRSDRYKPTTYADEKSMLAVKENGAYTLSDNQRYTNGIPNGNQMATNGIPMVYPGKDSIGKYSKDKYIARFPENEALGNAFKDFAEMRAKIKSPLTDRAVEMAIAKLEALAPGDDATKIEILRQSTFNCWKGLFKLDGRKAPEPEVRTNYNDMVTKELLSEMEGIK